MKKTNVKTTEKEVKKQILDIMENYSKSPDEMIEFLKFQSRFYQYSARNCMLIYMQNMGAELCQSFKAWGKEEVNGKPVKILKGQHGMKILVPAPVTLVQVSEDETKTLYHCTEEQKKLVKEGKLPVKKIMKYKIGTTFDIAQTDYPAEEYPKRLNRGVVSVEHGKIFNGLKKYSEEKCGVPFYIGDSEKDINGAALFGFCRYNPNPEIHLARNLKDTQMLSVGGHEFGHAMMHGIMCDKSTNRKEVEADMFGILLDLHFGLEIENTRKNHLKDNFDALVREVTKDVKSEEVEKIRQKAIADAYEDVNKAFREHINGIDKMILAE